MSTHVRSSICVTFFKIPLLCSCAYSGETRPDILTYADIAFKNGLIFHKMIDTLVAQRHMKFIVISEH